MTARLTGLRQTGHSEGNMKSKSRFPIENGSADPQRPRLLLAGDECVPGTPAPDPRKYPLRRSMPQDTWHS